MHNNTSRRGLIRSDWFRSETTGRCYWIDRDGKATPISTADYLDGIEASTADPDWCEYIPDEDGSEAFARMLERRAENGTWFGRDD